MKKKILVLSVIMLSMVANSEDAMEHCASIKSNKERLACFDQLVLFVRKIEKSNPSQDTNPAKTSPTTLVTISGGFGYGFGDEFDISKAQSVEEQYNGINTYHVTPASPHELFSQYQLEITPTSHKIYKITGTGRIKDESTCKNKKDVIANKLTDKYQAQKESFGSTTVFIKKEETSIMLDCNYIGGSDLTSYNLSIVYEDKAIKQTAKQEAIERESKRISTKGL